jgi:unsaturated rhamnogalacturonyl hydrolase
MNKQQDMTNRKRKTGMPPQLSRGRIAAWLFCISLIAGGTSAQTGGSAVQPDSWSAKMAATVMSAWKDTLPEGATVKWNYDQGVVLRGMEGLWYNTGDGRYFRYIQQCMDRLVDKQGNIATYKLEDYNLDNILCGRILLLLYKVTNLDKYYKAAVTLRQQLKDQPRTNGGSFWHKRRYPSQVWLDGLYMAQPFYAEYASLFHEDTAFNDIARQFAAIEHNARNTGSGLLYHGWDESREQKWADKTTGNSPNFWGRAMGWYGMALVDALDYFPADHPGRATLQGILQRFAAGIVKVQDRSSGLWWDVLDKPGVKGNYEEASASCMFVYTLAKGVRRGWLPAGYLDAAKKGYEGVLKKFTGTATDGQLELQGTVAVSGLGGDPYRDGSYAYYTGEKVVTNDQKGIGAFLLASDEMELLPTLSLGKGRTVMLDYYFNNEHKKDITGMPVRYHYTWEDQANSGFSLFGHVFRGYGMHTDSLPSAPTAENLRSASLYIIVDPDDEKESPAPNYPSTADINTIYDWVKDGGVLLLMSNDSGNAEFAHFNHLTEKFGIHFKEDSRNKVIGNKYEMGAFTMTVQDAIFKTTKKIYIKELSTLRLTAPAKPYFTEGGDVIMATAKIGKGTVFAVGDPWFYNEYFDGRKLPAEYENYHAGKDLAKWLIQQAAR